MSSREINSIIQQQFVFLIEDILSNGLKPGNIVFDLAGFESVSFFIFSSDDWTDGVFELVPKHGDVEDTGQHVPVPADDLTNAAISITEHNQFLRIGYVGKKQFISADINVTGVTTGGTVGAIIIANTPRRAPTPLNIGIP